MESNGVFVLGICYGLQLIVERLGGTVRVGEKQEYGRMEIEVEKASGLFGGSRKVGDKQVVWMSHGDEAVKLPDGFEVVARSQQGSVAAVECTGRRFYGLQYHPEVVSLVLNRFIWVSYLLLFIDLFGSFVLYSSFVWFLTSLFLKRSTPMQKKTHLSN